MLMQSTNYKLLCLVTISDKYLYKHIYYFRKKYKNKKCRSEQTRSL